MIAFITGRIAGKGVSDCVIEVGGVGLRLMMSTGSLAALPHEGDTVTVYTHLHVREDELSLFGFESPAEKELFERLITVSGVGPKVALAALSAYDPGTLSEAIVNEDAAIVSSVPGIGGKTAQRIILELKDKLGPGTTRPGTAAATGGAVGEARDALLAMGFSAAEVSSALRGAKDGSSPRALVKEALRRLGGGAA